MAACSRHEMDSAGLEVKESKCALMYDRRSGNDWYKGKNNKVPEIFFQGKKLPLLKRNEFYKYLGKSIGITGEDQGQITDFLDDYKNMLIKIKVCSLPLNLKVSAFNNLALGKILHHFYNTRLNCTQLKEIDNNLKLIVKELFDLYKSTTNSVIFLPREIGGLGLKKVSDVYITTRVAFLLKMLNHPVEHFKYIARTSLALDMKKRGVQLSENENNFLGYQVNDNGFLNTKTKFGCASDWLELSHYARKLDILVKYYNDSAVVYKGNNMMESTGSLQKRLLDITTVKRIEKAKQLSLQGNYIKMEGIIMKTSHSIFYNWKVDDDLVRFCLKARINILPTNFTKHIWNNENNPQCYFCKHATESMAHVLNGCKQFQNYYSRRHNRIVSSIFNFLKQYCIDGFSIQTEKMAETIFPEYRNNWQVIPHRKPDIVIVNKTNMECIIVEVTVPYDLYFNEAKNAKMLRYTPYCNLLEIFNYTTKLIVLCFGSLGTIDRDVRSGLGHFKPNAGKLKELMKWCSISAIIGSNYIWRSRVKMLLR